MVIVQIGDKRAIINNLVVTSADKATQRRVEVLLPLYGPSPADPDPDFTVAQQVVSTYNGVIKFYQKPPTEGDGKVY